MRECFFKIEDEWMLGEFHGYIQDEEIALEYDLHNDAYLMKAKPLAVVRDSHFRNLYLISDFNNLRLADEGALSTIKSYEFTKNVDVEVDR